MQVGKHQLRVAVGGRPHQHVAAVQVAVAFAHEARVAPRELTEQRHALGDYLGADAVDGGEQPADLVLAQCAVEVTVEIAQAVRRNVSMI